MKLCVCFITLIKSATTSQSPGTFWQVHNLQLPFQFVCLFVCEQHFRKCANRFSRHKGNNLKNLGVSRLTLEYCFFYFFYNEILAITGKWMNGFYEIFCKVCTWDKQQTGSVFACNVMEKWVNEFSWNFHEMSGTTQVKIILTVSRLQ